MSVGIYFEGLSEEEKADTQAAEPLYPDGDGRAAL